MSCIYPYCLKNHTNSCFPTRGCHTWRLLIKSNANIMVLIQIQSVEHASVECSSAGSFSSSSKLIDAIQHIAASWWSCQFPCEVLSLCTAWKTRDWQMWRPRHTMEGTYIYSTNRAEEIALWTSSIYGLTSLPCAHKSLSSTFLIRENSC